jgi:Na+-transporting NADH:ubiquinone oxidoreductase subunit A
MLFHLKRGLDIRLPGEPAGPIRDAPATRSVALLGFDYVDLKPSLKVAVGDSVYAGQCLFEHRLHSDLKFTAPGTGRVAEINRGPRRSLDSVVIELVDDEEPEPARNLPRGPLNPAAIRETLIAAGLWSAFRTRPYSRVPAPAGSPASLFVTAMDTQPLAPDPVVVIAEREVDFQHGLSSLCTLFPGPVYLCTAPDVSLPVPQAANLRSVQFAGAHPAGLPGTHIHFLQPGVSTAAEAWYIGYQDVMSIGHLLRTGRPSRERVISVAGPGTACPRLLRTRTGADLRDVLGAEFAPDVRVISGSLLSGRQANPHTRFLGRYHNQVTLIPEYRPERAGPTLPRRLALLAATLVGDLTRPGRAPADAIPTTRLNGWPTGMLSVEAFDAVWPLRDPPTPLLRALLTGDTETAAALGCMTLDEEDLALCAYICPSKQDYAGALRDTLRALEQAG